MALVDSFQESKVTIKKVELLGKLRANRTTHRKDFEEAEAGFRSAAIERLQKMLADAQEGKEIEQRLDLSEPTEHTKDYERVICMLEMSTAEEITVSESQFRQYVMDEWGWKQDFEGTTSLYNGAKARRR